MFKLPAPLRMVTPLETVVIAFFTASMKSLSGVGAVGPAEGGADGLSTGGSGSSHTGLKIAQRDTILHTPSSEIGLTPSSQSEDYLCWRLDTP